MTALTKTPPTPMGTYSTDGQRLGVPELSARSYAAALAHHGAERPPCSNTGMLHPAPHAPAFVDYLSYTLKGGKRILSRVPRHVDHPDGLEELRAALWAVADDDFEPYHDRKRAAAMWGSLPEPLPVDCTGRASMRCLTGRRVEVGLYLIARTMLEAVAPALMVGDLTGKGLNGYRDHAPITTHLGERCGSIAVGGNRDTVNVILTGRACRDVDMPGLADALDAYDLGMTKRRDPGRPRAVKIGRLDSAWDDLGGDLGTPHDAARKYSEGGFTPARGTRSETGKLVDDLGTGKGATFYLGDRKTRLLRIYMKGQQLGQADSPWCRYEVQWMGSAFDLTTANLRAPGALLVSYPDLAHLPVGSDGTSAHRIQREAEITAARTAQWLKTTCGASIALVADAIGPDALVELVRGDDEKVSRRLRGIADTRAQVACAVGAALLDLRKLSPVASSPTYQGAVEKLSNEQVDREGGSRIGVRGRTLRHQREGQGLQHPFPVGVAVPQQQVSRKGHAHA